MNVASSPQDVGRLVPLIAHAIAVFGDEQKAVHWLSTPLPLFDDRAPQDLLGTSEGLKFVDEVLTRIEHNIPS
jgi:putative toxin-antitoxin system antitoxin component (TIGR02293 family)